jgi:hypothetical protein
MLQVASPPIWPLMLLIVPLPPRIRLLTRVNKTKTYGQHKFIYDFGHFSKLPAWSERVFDEMHIKTTVQFQLYTVKKG